MNAADAADDHVPPHRWTAAPSRCGGVAVGEVNAPVRKEVTLVIVLHSPTERIEIRDEADLRARFDAGELCLPSPVMFMSDAVWVEVDGEELRGLAALEFVANILDAE